MFEEQRISKIKHYLLEHSSADYKTLCDIIPASLSTVRRDIDRLESEGFLIKKRGGIVLSDDLIKNVSYVSNDENIKVKMDVGYTAARLVRNGQIIFIGAGNTCWQMSKFITAENLTVVTHSFNVVMELAKKPNVRLIFLGGNVEVENGKYFTSGSYVYETIKNLYIEKSFITANGISDSYGYTINNNYLADIYTALLNYSYETCVLADATKFDKRAFRKICDFNQIGSIVTTIDYPNRYMEIFQDNNIKVFTPTDTPA